MFQAPMISAWWLVAVSAGWFLLMIWNNWLSYRRGILHGAFNHCLPVVMQEMVRYDAQKAKAIFENDVKMCVGP